MKECFIMMILMSILIVACIGVSTWAVITVLKDFYTSLWAKIILVALEAMLYIVFVLYCIKLFQ